MAPSDPLTVTPAEIVAHADVLFHLSSDVAAARAVGQRVTLASGAYGHVCVAIPVALSAVQGRVVIAIDAAAHRLYGDGEKLLNAADGYRTSDTDAAATLANSRIRLAQ